MAIKHLLTLHHSEYARHVQEIGSILCDKISDAQRYNGLLMRSAGSMQCYRSIIPYNQKQSKLFTVEHTK